MAEFHHGANVRIGPKKPIRYRTLALGIESLDAPTHEARDVVDFADIELCISPRVPLAAVLDLKDNPITRLFSMFMRLTRLSLEDDRLKAILDGYKIEIHHGDKRLWPPPV